MVASDPVSSESGIPLEVEECPCTVRPEHAVDPASVEPKASEAQLQIGDVVAPHHRRVEIEVAVAQAVASLDQCSHGSGVETTVFMEAPFGLEAAETGLGVRAEEAFDYLGFGNRVSELEEASVKVPDGFTTGSPAGRVVFRHDSGSSVRPGGPA